MKVQITLDDELMKRVDAYADENYMSRSGLLSIAVTQYLNTKEMIGAITRMGVAMEKIADKGEVDEQTRQELEDFQRMCALFGAATAKM